MLISNQVMKSVPMPYSTDNVQFLYRSTESEFRETYTWRWGIYAGYINLGLSVLYLLSAVLICSLLVRAKVPHIIDN